MKAGILFFLYCLFLLAGCRQYKPADPLQHTISQSKAKTDLFYFKDILKQAHPSLTLYKDQKRLDYIFDSISTSITGSLSLSDFYNSLSFITDEIGCSHTGVSLPDAVYDSLQNRKYFFPYPVLLVEDKLLVNVVGYDLPEGTQIVAINGISADQVLQKIAFYNPIEGFHRKTQQGLAARDLAFQYYLNYGQKDLFELEIIDTAGQTKRVFEEPVTYGEWNTRNSYDKYYFDGMAVDYDLDINDDKGYAVLRLPTFDFEGPQKQRAFENFCNNSFELLHNKKNITLLIIDIRDNVGGLLYGSFLLFSYLAEKPFAEYESVACKMNKLPYRNLLSQSFIDNELSTVVSSLTKEFRQKKRGYYYYADSLITNWSPDKNRFSGKVFVITNSKTVSAASYFALMVKKSGVGNIIGDETAGGSYSGNGFKTLSYVLPSSGIVLTFPYAHILYSYKEDKNTGRGVVPNYIVPDTYESFRQNDDKQRTYILDSLN